jgi:hypothetical protein
MEQWTVQEPQSLDVKGVRRLEVRLVGGRIDVVGGTDGDSEDAGTTPGDRAARVEVTRVDGPLVLTLEDDGTLRIAHEQLSWGGIFEWLGDRRRSVAHLSVSLPRDCPVRLGLVSADAVVSGLRSGEAAVRSVSGDVTLDGLVANVAARTVSGALDTSRLDGDLDFTTVSGDLTVVRGTTRRLAANSVSGTVTLDLDVLDAAELDVKTVSGDLTLRVPAETSLDVDVRSTSGHLQSSFAGLHTERSPGKARMRGLVGAGHGKLRAKTVSGDVTLLARVSS